MNAFEMIKRERMGVLINKIEQESCRKSFSSAEPFHNIAIDGMFHDDIIDELSSSFPDPSQKKWWVYNNALEKKLAFNDLTQLPGCFSKFFEFMNSPVFVTFLEKLTGLKGLVPDPSLNGGGLHQILPGGKLDVHEDYNIHRDLKAFRKVNAILYLNKEWDESYGGYLEFWNKEMTKCVQKFLPLANRLVIFRTDQTSNHGHPVPLASPDGTNRKSLATYYYLPTPEVATTPYKSTQFKRSPGLDEDPSVDELRKKRSQGRVEDKTT